jgi:hypothetical protein
MTNDQFPMTNDGGRTERAVPYYSADGTSTGLSILSLSKGFRHCALVIGIWSLPQIIREGVRE